MPVFWILLVVAFVLYKRRKQGAAKAFCTEALEYKRLFGDSAQLVLVSSAAHLPRAMNHFQKAGLEPLAAPTDYLVKKEGKLSFWFWLPSSTHIRKMESALHEYAGLLWAKMGGE